MKRFLSTVLISVVVSGGMCVGLYYLLQGPTFGTTVTTINGSDQISTSRTTINDNFTALNVGKIEVSTTSVGNIIALPNLASIGTITSGTWTGTPIGVAYSGTGTTSPTLNQIMFGDGSSGFKVIGFGSNGQSLVSGGAGVAPSWSSVSADQTQNYVWTGTHTFTNTVNATGTTYIKSLNASSTVVVGGVTYVFPVSQGAVNTTPVNNGSGTLSWAQPPIQQYSMASTSASSMVQNKTITTAPINIAAGTLTASSTITVDGTFTCITAGSGGTCHVKLIDVAGTTYIDQLISPGTTGTCILPFRIKAMANQSTSAQATFLAGKCLMNSGTAEVDESQVATSAANWANATQFEMQFTTSNTTALTASLTGLIMTVTP